MIRYRINQQQQLVTVLSSGGHPMAEWEATLEEMIASCPDVLTYDSISDGRGMRVLMNTAQVHELVSLNQRKGVQNHPRRAVHLISSETAFSVSRMYELMAEHDSLVSRLTTDSIEQAANWLGRPVRVIKAELDALRASQGAQS